MPLLKQMGTLTDIGCETKSGGTEWNSGSIGYILTKKQESAIFR